MKQNKKILILTALCLLSAVVLFAANGKEEDSQVCGGKKQVESVTKSVVVVSIADSINVKYNYSKKGNKDKAQYDMTFLEFGSTGCKPCQMMEEVMKSVRAKYPRVNVVFINVSKKETRAMADYFKIEQIPTQVLLDKSGKEYFRHVGYLSMEELEKNFRK